MRHYAKNSGRALRRAALGLIAVAAFLVPAPVAAAHPSTAEDRSSVIVLPGAQGAEGIAAGKGSTFYAGDLVTGDIFRGDIRKGTAKKFIDAPDGRVAVGLKADMTCSSWPAAARDRRMSTTSTTAGQSGRIS